MKSAIDFTPLATFMQEWDSDGRMIKALDSCFTDLAFNYIGADDTEKANQNLFYLKQLRDVFIKMDTQSVGSPESRMQGILKAV